MPWRKPRFAFGIAERTRDAAGKALRACCSSSSTVMASATVWSRKRSTAGTGQES
jgi:hypothetical protein